MPRCVSSRKFDKYSPPSFRLSQSEIEGLMAKVSAREMEDIKLLRRRSETSPRRNGPPLRDIEVETLPGVILGHKNVPVQSVGCYVPAGKFPMVASAHMSVATASVAGVPGSLPRRRLSGAPNPAVITAMHLGGAHEIYVLGGFKPSAPWHLEPRRLRLWTCWSGLAMRSSQKPSVSSMVASESTSSPGRPRRWLLLDDTVDAEMCATDLLGQAEHGYNSPAILVTTRAKARRGDDRGGGAIAEDPADGQHGGRQLARLRRGYPLRYLRGNAAGRERYRIRARPSHDGS